MRLPPFRLVQHVATGGYAHVFRAIHEELGVPVAVKVLKLEPARAEALLETFRGELTAMADLDHPHVAAVFDHGVVDGSAAHSLPALLSEGDPYLAMEWASGGSLAARPHARSFASLRATLLALLDALGHVHARGVIHRDVKPANVLVCTERDPRPGPKLADFGISRRSEEATPGSTRVVGTPQYMAPEQIIGATREEGPWTDLYSLGCLAYRLASGQTPFHDTSRDEVTRAHLVAEVPPLSPRFAVPEGFSEWLGVLLAKHPRARFACAADAAAALGGLAGRRSQSTRVVSASHAGAASSETTLDLTLPLDAPEPARRGGPGAPRSVARSWRRDGDAPALWARGLRARSAALVGLRSPAMVGREGARDELWGALVDVHERGASRAVRVEGPAGIGKTRLVQWLARRAVETGAAQALFADPWSGGVAGALARHLGVSGHGSASVVARLEGVLSDRLGRADRLGLAELLATPSRSARPRATSPRERHELLRRGLAALAAERAVVLVLDDAHGADDDLAALAHISGGDLALLVLLAARPDACSAATLAALGALDAAVLELGPLPDAAWPELVGDVLGLEGSLAARVEERAAGNPGFAIELIHHWLDAGRLVAGPDGFTLESDPEGSPASLAEAWDRTVEDAFAGLSPTAALEIECAAALGVRVDPVELASLLLALEVPPGRGGLDRLRARHLLSIERGSGALVFAHAALRERIALRSLARGDGPRIHAACAACLEGPPFTSARLRRRGEHLLRAGALERALEPLLDGARELQRSGDARAATSLLEARERAIEQLGLPESDPRRGDGWLLTSSIEATRGRLDEAVRWADRAQAAIDRFGWDRLRGPAALARCRVEVRRGRIQAARDAAEAARSALTTHGPARELAIALVWLARACVEQGELDAARAHALEARERFRAMDEREGECQALHELGFALKRANDVRGARRVFEEALAIGEAIGDRVTQAQAHNMLGELAREQGDLETAEAAYGASIPLYEAVGSSNVHVGRLNLSLALLAAGRWDRAEIVLTEALRGVRIAGFKVLEASAQVELTVCHAAAGEWAAYDARFDQAEAALRESDAVDPDMAWAAELAGDLAAAAGHRERGLRALRLAHAQWTRLGDETRAARAGERIAALSGC